MSVTKYEYKSVQTIHEVSNLGEKGWKLITVSDGWCYMERVISTRAAKPDPDLLTEEFLKVWEYYGPHGNRKVSSGRWAKITEEEKQLIRVHLPSYIESTKVSRSSSENKTFRKNFESYLFQKHWENELSKKIVSQATLIKNKCLKNPDYINSPEHFRDLAKITNK